MSELPYINLGCGTTFHKDWTNVDFVSHSEFVMSHNLLNGIPFSDNSFEFVYHSHVLEHMPKKYAPEFIGECYRILKPGGIIRVAIPDLEQIAKNYIRYLNDSLDGKTDAQKKYEWTMLEMYDQVVRNKTGGEMMEYIKEVTNQNDDFLLERNGKEVESIINQVRNQKPSTPSSKFKTLLSSLYHFNLKNALLKLLLKKNNSAMNDGLFRSRGEIHQWMYDRYSLKKILEEKGFINVIQRSAFESYLPDWQKFNLDGVNGKIRKPDSLFMEGIKK